MTESKEKETKKKLSLSRPGKLELKKTVEGGQVRQNFSHGRSKVVTVEVRKKRTFAAGAGGAMTEVKEQIEPLDTSADGIVDAVKEAPVAIVEVPTAAQTDHLTESERAVRARALQDAQAASAAKALEPDPEPESEVKQPTAAELTAEVEISTEALRRQELGKAAGEAGIQKLKEREIAQPEDEEGGQGKGRGKVSQKRPSSRRGEPRRRSGKLTIAEALDETERVRSLASVKRARDRQKVKEGPIEHKKIVREVTVPETITVQELANRMAERSVEVVKTLMKLGVMTELSAAIDADTAELVVAEFGHTINRVSDSDVEIGLVGDADDEADLVSRPPVVTVMGHVDHGKTSLLDALRNTSVVDGEAGGITQHIGAYQVTVGNGQLITFIDTPGHEAFTAMRARGAGVTDIVVLVVAADDGIMPQTIEAISHSKAAAVPIIVAINKIDKPGGNPTRIRTQLLEHEIVLESMGGDVLDIEVSATEGTNLDKLVETIALQAEILDLKANPNRTASGTVIEVKVEHGRGTVATVLVQNGTLKTGDIFVAGAEWGRVRALLSDSGENIKQAGPSEPVEVIGLNGTPDAGDDFVVVESEAKAREVSGFRQSKDRLIRTSQTGRGSLEDMFSAIKAGEAKELPVIIKADVQGSVEAIIGMLEKLPQDEVDIQILHHGVGGINQSDVSLANTTGAVVLGFNVRANRQARDQAQAGKIDIRYYSVIYDLVDDIKSVLIGLMAPEMREMFLGNAEIREVFNISKVGRVAGCMISEGVVRRGSKVRLVRDSVVVHEGSLSTLKRFKEDVREVRESFECGMSFESYNDIKVGDIIECFDIQEIAPTL